MTAPIKTTPLGMMQLPGIIEIPWLQPARQCECGNPALSDTVTIQICESDPSDKEISHHVSVAGWKGGEPICEGCLPQALADWPLGVLVIRVV